MSAYRVGFLPLPRMVDLLIWISILFVSIFMYLEITLAISCLIISSISGEQPARSEIRRILSLSFAISLELYFLNKLGNLMISAPPDSYEIFR